MSNPNVPPLLPLPGDGRDDAPPTIEEGDGLALDPDADADQIDSAAADRLASGEEPERDGRLL